MTNRELAERVLSLYSDLEHDLPPPEWHEIFKHTEAIARAVIELEQKLEKAREALNKVPCFCRLLTGTDPKRYGHDYMCGYEEAQEALKEIEQFLEGNK